MYILSWIVGIFGFIAFLGMLAGALLIAVEKTAAGVTTIIVCFVLTVVLAFSQFPIYRATETTQQVTVKSKERIAENKSGRYLVYTEQETFENTDSLAFGKFNSSDLYGALEPGKTYTCKVAGWRVQLFSDYRNLIECK